MEDANIHFLLIIHTISSDYKGKMQKLLERFSFKESSGAQSDSPLTASAPGAYLYTNPNKE